MVEMLRVYMGGEGWNPEVNEVKRGVLAICEDLGYHVKVRESMCFGDDRMYMRRADIRVDAGKDSK